MTRDDFLKRVGELLLQMKFGEEDRVELKTLEEKVAPPSAYVLGSRVASVIDAFIESGGLTEFASNRLHLIIDKEYRVSISEPQPRFVKNALISLPLSDLKLELMAVREGGPLRHIAIDRAALSVTTRLARQAMASDELADKMVQEQRRGEISHARGKPRWPKPKWLYIAIMLPAVLIMKPIYEKIFKDISEGGHKRQIEELVAKTAQQISPTLPHQVDSQTAVISVTGDGGTLVTTLQFNSYVPDWVVSGILKK